MFEGITYYMIFGKPLIMYGGIITLISLLITASIAVLNKKGITKIPVMWHQRMAMLTVALALIHGILGILAFF